MSYFPVETKLMERLRRELEQQGHHFTFDTKVHARVHNTDSPSADMGGEDLQNIQSTVQQHPYLDSPLYDGIDPNVNPAPALNTDARRDYDNDRREQEMEKQNRLQMQMQNNLQFNPKPRPY